MKRYGVLFSLIMVGSLAAQGDDHPQDQPGEVVIFNDVLRELKKETKKYRHAHVFYEAGERKSYTRPPEVRERLVTLERQRRVIRGLIEEFGGTLVSNR